MAAGRKTGGRQKGTPNKVTTDIRALAGTYSQEAMDRLAKWMRQDDNPGASISAAKEIIERAHGKAFQPVGGSLDGPPIQHSVKVEFVKKD